MVFPRNHFHENFREIDFTEKIIIGRIGYLFAIIGFGKQTNAWYF